MIPLLYKNTDPYSSLRLQQLLYAPFESTSERIPVDDPPSCFCIGGWRDNRRSDFMHKELCLATIAAGRVLT
jgi:hypothetical protein